MTVAAALISAWAVIANVRQDPVVFPTLPPDLTISDSDFGALVETLSEPEGYFDTDNFITNETSYLHVVDRLEEDVRPNGVYLGVGPDQNFSYIVHTRPSLAIVTDIRRQNMLQHLLLKVLIERAEGRADYLCSLLGRNCEHVREPLALDEMLAAIRRAPASADLLGDAIVVVRETLLDSYGLSLSAVDLERIEYVHRSFASAGLAMRFSSFGRSSTGYPTLEEILLERDLDGEYQNYLATDDLFRRLQEFQRENRLIPVVGDFAGREALPRIAQFLKDHDLEVATFYVSNVEFYLTGLPAWGAYVENLKRFPFRPDAVFVRAYFPTGWPRHPLNVGGHRPTSLVQDVQGFLDDAATRRQWNYWDIVTRHIR
jgi:hypothetical protein